MTSFLPLKGKHILITRGGEKGEKFCTDVASAGGIPHMIPFIDFRAYVDFNASNYMKNLSEYDWIIFTSQNGVHYFFKHIRHFHLESTLHANDIQYAVVGEKTREALQRYKLSARFMPHVYTAEDFAKEFSFDEQKIEKVLIPKGNLASNVIAEAFRSLQMTADEWIVYETFFPTSAKNLLIQLLKKEIVDVITFTSPSTFNHFEQIIRDHYLAHFVRDLTFAAIGTVTKRKMEQVGYDVSICPDTFTIDHLFQEICQHFLLKGKE